MTDPPLIFLPLLPWLPWAGLAAVALAATGFALWRRSRGAALRGLGFILLLAVLAGPHWSARTTTPLPDIALVLLDRSASMQIGNRAALAATALAGLRHDAGATQLQVVEVLAGGGGTTLFAALAQALALVPPAQLAGVVAITDGEVTDPPARLGAIPLSTWLTAAGPQTDRELRLAGAPAYGLAGPSAYGLAGPPAYGLVGQAAGFSFTVIDHGMDDTGAAVAVQATADGVALPPTQAVVGKPTTVQLPITHAGPMVVTFAAAPLPGEVSLINNQAAFTVTGVQKRLRILLISGSPDQGERSWRLLLKADPAVDLLHFTILRTPGEPIDAVAGDLALVPFPVRQLFVTDINKFDLIIMDRFDPVGLLPADYLANIAQFVQHGGALLAELGPEFAGPDSLAATPLAAVLPAAPMPPGTVDQAFAPQVTAAGARHPVTAPLAGQVLPPWYRLEAAAPAAGDVLMTGAGGAPLLLLAPAGKGRVGMLLSDQFWLWTRGGAHDGPALPLLRRMVHWLLREPALEAESLTAAIDGGQLKVTRQTMAAAPPAAALVTAPDGHTASLALTAAGPGRYSGTMAATVAATAAGVWRVSQSGLTAYAAGNAGDPLEYQDLAATDSIMRPLSRQVIWLGANPRPAPVLTPRHAVAITGARDVPLLPPLPTMLVALALLFAAWWRESV